MARRARRWMPRLMPLAVAAGLHAQQGTSRIGSFVDREAGVSFRYPSSWVREKDEFSPEQTGYYIPGILTLAASGRRVRISLDRNPFPGTEFVGLAFAFFGFSSSSDADCIAPWSDESMAAEHLGPVTIKGVRFHVFATGGAGMCHQASGKVYAAFRGGRCYLF